MIQEIITFSIILGAVTYSLFHFIKLFLPEKKGNNKHACSSGCSGCSIKHNPKFSELAKF